jgi:hypothetical protein
MLNGFEFKDTTYFSAVTETSKMPEQITQVLEAFSESLRDYHYRNQWSMEIRVKDGQGWFTDATCRGGMPSSASQQLLWKNFSEIVWAGSNGELVEPEFDEIFSIECMVSSKCKKDCWDVVDLPEKLWRNVRLSSCCLVEDRLAFPPDEHSDGDLGWLCVTGYTPKDVLQSAKEIADQLPDGLDAKLENMVGLIKEIESAEEQGIPFTKKPVPEPAEVIND